VKHYPGSPEEIDLRPPEPQATEPVLGTDDEPPFPTTEETPVHTEPEITELTDEERALFRQLMTVGRRTKTIDVMGHQVSIASLRVSDELRIGLYCKPYEGIKMEPRAYQLAVCAAGIQSVDGQPLYQPLTGAESEDELFTKRVEILENYYPIVITEIYRAIMDLDVEFAELAEKLGKLKG